MAGPSLRVITRYICLLCFACLGGCTGSNVSTTDKFNSDSPDGIVVVGAKLSKEYVGLFSMAWCLYNENRKVLPPRPSDCLVIQRGDFAESDISVARSQAHYFVNKLKPGTYGLRDSGLQIGKIRNSVTYSPTTVAFKLGAGEVIYIGTFSFDVPKSMGSWSTPMGRIQQVVDRNDEEARIVLSKYSGIEVDMKFVPVHQIQVDDR
jgi:hypothetical protein